MEGPPDASGANVVRADVARRRAFSLTDARTLNEKILVDDARTGRNQKGIADLASKSDGEVDETRVAERAHRPPGARVERVETAPSRKEDSSIVAIHPVGNAAVHVRLTLAAREWIEPPDQRTAVRAESDDGKCGRRRVEHAVDDDWRRLDFRAAPDGCVSSVKGPGDAELRNGVAIDLIQR